MRQQIISDVERHLCALGELAPILGSAGLCLYIAHVAALTLYKHGLRPVIQAGSLQWPRMRRDEDDGRCNTHFAYMWEPGSPQSIASWASGNLPEMHVWIGLTAPQTLIDFSTRHLKDVAAAEGMTWTAPEPPRYVWTAPDDLPDWVAYHPNRDATILAAGILWKLFQPPYLKNTAIGKSSAK